MTYRGSNMSLEDIMEDLRVQRAMATLRRNSPGKIMAEAKRNRRNSLFQLRRLIDSFPHVRNQQFKEFVKQNLHSKYSTDELELIIRTFPRDGGRGTNKSWWNKFWGQDLDGRIGDFNTRLDALVLEDDDLGGEVYKRKTRKRRRGRTGRTGRRRTGRHGKGKAGRRTGRKAGRRTGRKAGKRTGRRRTHGHV